MSKGESTIYWGVWAKRQDNCPRLLAVFIDGKEAAEWHAQHLDGEVLVQEVSDGELMRWGYGRGSRDPRTGAFIDYKLGETKVGDVPVELLFGEHPHSRKDDETYARFPDGRIEEFSGHAVRIRVDARESNYMKSSDYSGDEIRKSASADIFFEDVKVGTVSGRDVERVLLNVLAKIPKIQEHPLAPYLWRDREAIVGRKVFWRDAPATIVAIDGDEVTVETESGQPFSMPAWRTQDDWPEPYESRVRISIWDPQIWWFRREKKEEKP